MELVFGLSKATILYILKSKDQYLGDSNVMMW